jgi:hypothetical protein
MKHFITQHYDLIFVAYAANDNGDVGASDQILIATEYIIRSLLKKKTALIYVSENILSDHAEKAYLPVTTYYKVPLLSYRNATLGHIRAHQPPVRNVFWMRTLDNPHPPNSVHQLVCDLCAYFFSSLVEYQQQQEGEGADGWSLPTKLYVDDEDTCGRSTSMSSLPQNNATSPFIPFTLPGPHSSAHRLHNESGLYHTRPCHGGRKQSSPDNCSLPYYDGWSYFEDRPGKPYGWIADSSTRSVQPSVAHVAFFLVTGTGKVGISYLSTYRNAGVFEVWLSTAYPKWKLQACSARKKETYRSAWFYPHSDQREVTKRVLVVDTYQNRSEVSNVDTQVMAFGCIGTVLVNLVHRPLPAEELARRGGDKVKILGLYGC